MDRISYLIGRYLQNRCTREELDEFLEFVKKNPNDEVLRDTLWNAWQSEDAPAGLSVVRPKRDFVQHAPAETVASAGKIMWRVAAAVLVLALGVLGFFVRPEDVSVSSAEVSSAARNTVVTSGDERRLIVQMKSDVPILGSLNMYLEKYTPGERLAPLSAGMER